MTLEAMGRLEGRNAVAGEVAGYTPEVDSAEEQPNQAGCCAPVAFHTCTGGQAVARGGGGARLLHIPQALFGGRNLGPVVP